MWAMCISQVPESLAAVPGFPCTGETRGLVQSLSTILVAYKQCFKVKHNTQGLFWHTAVPKPFEAGNTVCREWEKEVWDINLSGEI